MHTFRPVDATLPMATDDACCGPCHDHEQSSSPARWNTFVLAVLPAGVLLSSLVVPWPTPWVAASALAVVGLAGWPSWMAAARNVRQGRLDMHLLVAIAVVGALATQQWLEGALTMWLFAASLWLENWQLQRARGAVAHSLAQLQPQLAHKVSVAHGRSVKPQIDSSWSTAEVPRSALQVGDWVLVRPGERVPVDGAVLDGAAAVDQAIITGESLPIDKRAGDTVFGGTLNQDGTLLISVQRSDRDSVASQIADVLRHAEGAPARMQRVVDRFARWYTPTVVAFALLVAVVPPGFAPVRGELPAWSEWFHRALVLLVISCPCALLISTPFTVFAGIHRAARRGIVVKGGEYLEAAGAVQALVFDKTGTLTTGKPRVAHIQCAPEIDETEALRIVAGLEMHSEHPLAQGLRHAASVRQIPVVPARQVEVLRGFGMRGEVSGKNYIAASPRYFATASIAWPEAWLQAIAADSDRSVIVLADDSRALALFFLEDTVRAEAGSTLERLRKLGIHFVGVMSGDRPTVVERLQAQLGTDESHADMLPLQKRDMVIRWAQRFPQLAFIGDGVNDAPALQAAPLGVAFGAAASPLALHTANVAILVPRLERLADLVAIGQGTRRRLRQNILLTLGIKAIAVGLAMLGWAPMWLAVLADVGATLLVIANGMRE